MGAWAFSLATALIFCTCGAASVLAADFRVVARQSGFAPGGPSGATFGVIGSSSIFPDTYADRFGRSAFIASMTTGVGGVTSSNDAGVWSEGGGTLNLLAREGNQAPDLAAGIVFDHFNDFLRVNNVGRTAFSATLKQSGPLGVSGVNDSGLWSGPSGAVQLVAREGSAAPGTGGGVFGDFSIIDYGHALNDMGQSLFFNMMQAGVGGVSTSNDTGIWRGTPGNVSLVAREGNAAPGTPAGAVFDNFTDFDELEINSAGQTVFRGTLKTGGGGVTTSNNAGVWSDVSGTISLVARSGNQAPGAPAGATFIAFDDPQINSSGGILFQAALAQGAGGVTNLNDRGLWSNRSGTLMPIVRGGEQAPGAPAGANFQFFYNKAINNVGQIAFVSVLNIGNGGVTAANSDGLWVERDGGLNLVARRGFQAPGTPNGAVFNTVGSPVLNESGRVAFNGSLVTSVGGVTSANDRGIWAEDRYGDLQLIVREGDSLELSPGIFGTVTKTEFYGNSGNGDGKLNGFTDDGYVAFGVVTTAGNAIIVSSKVAALPGDYDGNGSVDAGDYVVWRKGTANSGDYSLWRSNFGRTSVDSGDGASVFSVAVPEPMNIVTVGSLTFLVACNSLFTRARHQRRLNIYATFAARRVIRTWLS